MKKELHRTSVFRGNELWKFLFHYSIAWQQKKLLAKWGPSGTPLIYAGQLASAWTYSRKAQAANSSLLELLLNRF